VAVPVTCTEGMAVARLVRVLKGVEDVYADEQGRLHIVLKAKASRSQPWIKRFRGNVLGVRTSHRVHDLGGASIGAAGRARMSLYD